MMSTARMKADDCKETMEMNATSTSTALQHTLPILAAMALALCFMLSITGCAPEANEDVSPAEIVSIGTPDGGESLDELSNADTDGQSQGAGTDAEAAPSGEVKDSAAAALIDEAIALGSDSQILDKASDTVAEDGSGISNDAKAQFARAWGKFSEMDPGLTEMNQEMTDLVMSEFFNFPNKIMAAYPYAVGAEGFSKLTVAEDDVKVLCSDALMDTVAKVIVTCRDEAGEPRLVIVGFYDQLSDSVKVESVSEVAA